MNDKEIKAIKMCRLLLYGDITLHIIDDDGGTAYAGTVNKTYNDDLETVLNLIEKQKAEIEEKDEYLELISKQLDNIAIDQIPMAIEELYIYLDKYKKEIETLKRDFEIVDHECSRLEQEDIRKDLMIKEMAEWLYEDDSIFGFGIFKEINTPEKIKEYFENKVKEK